MVVNMSRRRSSTSCFDGCHNNPSGLEMLLSWLLLWPRAFNTIIRREGDRPIAVQNFDLNTHSSPTSNGVTLTLHGGSSIADMSAITNNRNLHQQPTIQTTSGDVQTDTPMTLSEIEHPIEVSNDEQRPECSSKVNAPHPSFHKPHSTTRVRKRLCKRFVKSLKKITSANSRSRS